MKSLDRKLTLSDKLYHGLDDSLRYRLSDRLYGMLYRPRDRFSVVRHNLVRQKVREL